MASTIHRRASAIAGLESLIFLSAVACSPNLNRPDALLTLEAQGISPDADRVLASIEAQNRRFSVDIAAGPEPVRFEAISVPTGPVTINLQTEGGGVLRQTRQVSVDLTRDVTVTVDFSVPPLDAGSPVAQFRSDPLTINIVELETDAISGGQLAVSAGPNASEWTTFIQNAEAALGRPPTRLSPVSSRISLGTAIGITALNQLWSPTLTVAIQVGQSRIDIATGSPPPDATLLTVPITADETTLDPIAPMMLTGGFLASVRGTTPLTSSDGVEAGIDISLVFEASAP